MKYSFFLIMPLFLLLLAGCGFLFDSEQNNSGEPVEPGEPGEPGESGPKTFIVFDNTQGTCAAFVYSSVQRDSNSLITEVPAGGISREFEWTAGSSVPFFFKYNMSLIGINDFTIEHTAGIEWNQTYIRIDADKKTNIIIPPIADTVSSPNDTFLSNNSHIIIQNSSSRSLRLLRSIVVINTDNNNDGANPGERVSYTLKSSDDRTASSYTISVMGTNTTFSILPTGNFELGRVYYFSYTGKDFNLEIVEIKLANLTVGSLNDPVNKTNVRFINQDDFSVSIYTNIARNNLISDVPAKGQSNSILTDPSISAVYYPNYNIVVEEVSIPYEGVSIVSRVDPKKTAAQPNNVYIPSLIRMLSQPDADPGELDKPLTSSIYIKVHNDVTDTLSFRRNSMNLFPQGSTSAVVNARETVIYVINNPGTAPLPVTQFEFREGTMYTMTFPGAVTEFKSGRVYSFRVEAGSPSNRLVLLADRPLTIAEAFALKPPESIIARNLPSGNISLSWDKAGTETSYEVYRAADSSENDFIKIGNAVTTSYTDSAVTLGKTYYYKLISVRDSYKSDMSENYASITAATSTLPSPAGVTATVQGASSISLSWTAVPGANAYIIYRGSASNSINTYVGSTPSSPFLVSGLEGDTTYWFTVSAASSNAESNPSAVVSGKTPQTLPYDEWKDDSITAGEAKDYFINVTKGNLYFIRWEDSSTGNRTKTCDIVVSAKYDNSADVLLEETSNNVKVSFNRKDSGYDSPHLFISDRDGSVKITVAGYYNSSSGTYSLRYFSREGGETALKENEWTSGELEANYQMNSYTLEVKKDNYYFIWLNRSSSSYGNGTKTGDVVVSAKYRTGSSSDAPFNREYNMWNTPYLFIAARDDVVILNVNGYYTSSKGTYELKYTTREGGIRALTDGRWYDDVLTANKQVNQYSFNVEQGKTYYVWLNRDGSSYGNSTKTGDIKASLEYETGSSSDAPFMNKYNLYNTPESFTAVRTGKVILSIEGYYTSSVGTYAVAYRTTNVRP